MIIKNVELPENIAYIIVYINNKKYILVDLASIGDS